MASSSKILLTTSRNPTSGVRTFTHDLTRVIPGIVRVNRGKMSMDEVAEKALEHNADRVVIINRWHGGPGRIEFFRIGVSGLVHVPPILYVAGIRLQREFALVKLKSALSLVITQSNENSIKIVDSSSKFFNLPVMIEKEVLSKHQVAMHISYDASGRVQITFMLLPQKVEIGPRITLSRVKWESTK